MVGGFRKKYDMKMSTACTFMLAHLGYLALTSSLREKLSHKNQRIACGARLDMDTDIKFVTSSGNTCLECLATVLRNHVFVIQHLSHTTTQLKHQKTTRDL